MKRFVTTGGMHFLLALICVLTGSRLCAADLQITEASLSRQDSLMVAAKDFETSGLARVRFDQRTNRVLLVRGNVTLVMAVGSRKAWLNGAAILSPVVTKMVKGQPMLPAEFVMKRLGLSGTTIKAQSNERSALHPAANITGRVVYAGHPLPDITLKLIRAKDSTFIPNVQVRTDEKGYYSFEGIPQGDYRVYAYVRDNPGFFNRATPTIQVGSELVKVDDIRMGRVLDGLKPARGTKLPGEGSLEFAWTACPYTAKYRLSIVCVRSNKEVFSTDSTKPFCSVPASTMSPDEGYVWHVTATDKEGTFLGGTPGCGTEPLTIGVVQKGKAGLCMCGTRPPAKKQSYEKVDPPAYQSRIDAQKAVDAK